MLQMPFMDPRIIDSPFAMPILKAAMGEKVFAYLPYGCNSTRPGSDIQWIHRDSGQLFPNCPLRYQSQRLSLIFRLLISQ